MVDKIIMLLAAACIIMPAQARAEFILSSAIIEFSAQGARQQDVELVSRSQHQDYIVSEIYRIERPGMPDEKRVLVEDPLEAGLLVTPDRTVLPGGGRRVLRFVLLDEPGDEERIYRVAIKPVIRGLETQHAVGLKILVGYEALVIVRPASPAPALEGRREGRTLYITNKGNSNILLQSGRQCPQPGSDAGCQPLPVTRIYAGAQATVTLPADLPVTYMAWDGQSTSVRQF